MQWTEVTVPAKVKELSPIAQAEVVESIRVMMRIENAFFMMNLLVLNPVATKEQQLPCQVVMTGKRGFSA